MKKIFKSIIASVMVCFSLVSMASCGMNYETPEWLKTQICDHVFDEEEIIKNPTCGENGKKLKICSECGETKIVSIKATGDHNLGQAEIFDGYKIETCLTCGDKIKSEFNECLHLNINTSTEGTNWHAICQDCGEEVLESATLTDVEKGDTLAGWYLVTPDDDCTIENVGLYFTFDIPELNVKDQKIKGPKFSFYKYGLSLTIHELTGIEGVESDLGEPTNEKTQSYHEYMGGYLIYIEPSGYTGIYTLERLEGEEYIVYATVEYTFNNIRYDSLLNSSIKKVNFLKY